MIDPKKIKSVRNPIPFLFAALFIIYAYVTREIDGWHDGSHPILSGIVACSSYSLLMLSVMYSVRNRLFKISVVVASSLFLFSNVLHYRYFSEPIHFGSLYSVSQLSFVSSYIIPLVKTGDLVLLIATALIITIYCVFAEGERPYVKRLSTLFGLFIVLTCFRFFLGILPVYNQLGGITQAFRNTLLNAWDRQGAVTSFGFMPNMAFEAYQLLTHGTTLAPDPVFSLQAVPSGPKPNVILIQVESLPLEIIGRRYAGIEATPFLNSLRKRSLFYTNIFPQHTAGGGTSDADFSILTSRTPPGYMPPFHASGLGGLTTLPKVLKAAGYSTFAYHANKGGFWGRKKAFYDMGFDRFISREDLPAPPANKSVLPDHLFFDSSLAILLQQQTPVFSYFITMTSHGPYNSYYYLPENEFNPVKLADNAELAYYLTAIRYVDKSVGSFVGKVQQLFKDHLIIIIGDHPPYLPSLGLKGNERVPLFIISGTSQQTGIIGKSGNQIDIPAMILTQLGMEVPPSWQGNGALAPKQMGESILPSVSGGHQVRETAQ